ncbi:MAG: efflux RND transporter periplasmic adaptor subunit [Planctomycetes bacterium]|nr:efflux RND transporter periplasmic adaptor subunit [Planctomycetota bacterium]
MHAFLALLPVVAPSGGKPVTTVRPERVDLSRSISRYGSAAAFQEATVLARVEGYVREVAVEEGDVATEGTVLASVAVPELEAELARARAKVAEAEASVLLAQAEKVVGAADVEVARADLDWLERETSRIEGLRRENAATEREAEESVAKSQAARARVAAAQARAQAAEAKERLARAQADAARSEASRLETLVAFSQVRAPYEKTLVTRRLVHPGALAEAGRTPLLSVADLERIRIRSDVPEREAAFLKAGTPVRIRGAGLPAPIEAKVTRTAGVVDVDSRNLRFEIEVPNPERRILPGLYLELRLELERRPEALTLPASALLLVGGKPHVFVVAEGRARQRPVETGLDDGARVEVVEGIGAEDVVVVGGKERLADGDEVVATPERGAP